MKKKQLVLVMLAIISLLVITVGVTYAFFNYMKEGTTDNTITTGTITFLYTEVSGVGNGISINDAYPISDTVGKAQTGNGKVFDFKVTSNTTNEVSIPYEVTARKKSDSTLDEETVKLYLTKVNGNKEEEILLDNYSNLIQTSKVLKDIYSEKTIYKGKVPSNSINYEQAFRLRMWIDEEVDFSPVKDENDNIMYPYNDKEFTVTVNVYANARVVLEGEVDLDNTTGIKTVSVNGIETTTSEVDEIDYEISVLHEIDKANINVETENSDATVEIEKVDSLAYSNIKRLAVINDLELNVGDNYFKITVTSANKQMKDSYILNIKRSSFTYDATSTVSTYDAVDVGHKHTGTSASGGGCYTSVKTGTRTVKCDVTNGAHSVSINNDGTYAWITFSTHSACGQGKVTTGHLTKDTYGSEYYASTSHTFNQNYTYYDLGCGQQETVEYDCPDGGTLEGTTCTVTTYTCPDGGTLDGTICVK